MDSTHFCFFLVNRWVFVGLDTCPVVIFFLEQKTGTTCANISEPSADPPSHPSGPEWCSGDGCGSAPTGRCSRSGPCGPRPSAGSRGNPTRGKVTFPNLFVTLTFTLYPNPYPNLCPKHFLFWMESVFLSLLQSFTHPSSVRIHTQPCSATFFPHRMLELLFWNR